MVQEENLWIQRGVEGVLPADQIVGRARQHGRPTISASTGELTALMMNLLDQAIASSQTLRRLVRRPV
jgi:hypothetical protein